MPSKRSNPKTIHRAGELRLNQTPGEARLWSRLRVHRLAEVGFRRQHAIGSFLVDFCAPQKKLVIELDGSQHVEAEEYDKERTVFLESHGYRVVRFRNDDVRKNIEAVLGEILFALEEVE